VLHHGSIDVSGRFTVCVVSGSGSESDCDSGSGVGEALKLVEVAMMVVRVCMESVWVRI
jgi:hypothetical protein